MRPQRGFHTSPTTKEANCSAATTGGQSRGGCRMQRMEKTMADIIDNFASISQVSRDAGDRHRQRAGDRHRQRHRSTSRGQCANRSSDDHSRVCTGTGPPLPPPRVRARIRTQPTWKRRTTRCRGQRPDSPHHTDSIVMIRQRTWIPPRRHVASPVTHKPELKRMKRWPMHMDQPNITKVGDHLELVSHAHMIACPQICEKGPRPIKNLDLRTICLWVARLLTDLVPDDSEPQAMLYHLGQVAEDADQLAWQSVYEWTSNCFDYVDAGEATWYDHSVAGIAMKHICAVCWYGLNAEHQHSAKQCNKKKRLPYKSDNMSDSHQHNMTASGNNNKEWPNSRTPQVAYQHKSDSQVFRHKGSNANKQDPKN